MATDNPYYVPVDDEFMKMSEKSKWELTNRGIANAHQTIENICVVLTDHTQGVIGAIDWLPDIEAHYVIPLRDMERL